MLTCTCLLTAFAQPDLADWLVSDANPRPFFGTGHRIVGAALPLRLGSDAGRASRGAVRQVAAGPTAARKAVVLAQARVFVPAEGVSGRNDGGRGGDGAFVEVQ
jgi:hypothetical protein